MPHAVNWRWIKVKWFIVLPLLLYCPEEKAPYSIRSLHLIFRLFSFVCHQRIFTTVKSIPDRWGKDKDSGASFALRMPQLFGQLIRWIVFWTGQLCFLKSKVCCASSLSWETGHEMNWNNGCDLCGLPASGWPENYELSTCRAASVNDSQYGDWIGEVGIIKFCFLFAVDSWLLSGPTVAKGFLWPCCGN